MTQIPPHFFGFGSLVNLGTHIYTDARPARLSGWRRTWVRSNARPLAFLSVTRAPGNAIDGLMAVVPGADWAALDEREYCYVRVDVSGEISHDLNPAPQVALYQVPEENIAPESCQNLIPLSYLDVVLRGYAQVFGEAGVHDFMASTDGWEVGILDDRATPGYPRHQAMTPAELALHDRLIAEIGAPVVTESL